jgi:methionyl-tRNA synthetase
MALADKANQYIDEKKPWSLMKDSTRHLEVQDICTAGINFFRILMIYLKPILPGTAKQVETFLNIPPLQWQDKDEPLLDHQLNDFQPLINRIDPKQIEALKMAAQEDIDKSAQASEAAPASTPAKETMKETVKEYISIDDFNKIDLRIANILEAESVEGADKLLRLKVDLGNETRQLFAGIKSAYQPDQLVGRQVVIVANLAPRKMRFGVSEGMVIVASGDEGGKLFIVSPDAGAEPGMKVK